eukprot:Skav205281  [mRNA]  locus=scaffold1690:112649:113047:- [translate_table: standard]
MAMAIPQPAMAWVERAPSMAMASVESVEGVTCLPSFDRSELGIFGQHLTVAPAHDLLPLPLRHPQAPGHFKMLGGESSSGSRAGRCEHFWMMLFLGPKAGAGAPSYAASRSSRAAERKPPPKNGMFQRVCHL